VLSIDGGFRVISTFLSDSHSYPPGLERNHGNCHIHPTMNMPFRTSLGAETPSPIATEVERRRTFAIKRPTHGPFTARTRPRTRAREITEEFALEMPTRLTRKVSMTLTAADIVQRGWRSNPNIHLGPNVIIAKANRSHRA